MKQGGGEREREREKYREREREIQRREPLKSFAVDLLPNTTDLAS